MADRLVFYVTALGAAFALGMWAGEEQSAVKLMPCPKEAGLSVVSRTADSCTYVKASQIYGKAQRVRKI